MTQAFTQDKRILVVDDIQSDRMLLEKILSNAGFTVQTADDGAACIACLEASPPDLIFLDINMTPVDGYMLCAQIKDSEHRDIPVIFISANTDAINKVQAFNSGGMDYITKPYQSEEVVARATVHIENHSLQQELRNSIEQLERALGEVKQLKGLLPICASCKNVRDDQGYWNSIESYVAARSDAEFSHALCPSCVESLYPQLDLGRSLGSASEE